MIQTYPLIAIINRFGVPIETSRAPPGLSSPGNNICGHRITSIIIIRLPLVNTLFLAILQNASDSIPIKEIKSPHKATQQGLFYSIRVFSPAIVLIRQRFLFG